MSVTPCLLWWLSVSCKKQLGPLALSLHRRLIHHLPILCLFRWSFRGEMLERVNNAVVSAVGSDRWLHRIIVDYVAVFQALSSRSLLSVKDGLASFFRLIFSRKYCYNEHRCCCHWTTISVYCKVIKAKPNPAHRIRMKVIIHWTNSEIVT